MKDVMFAAYKKEGTVRMRALKWVNVGAFAAMIAVNALANLLPIGGNTTGQVSEAYPNLFTPASVTFAIWGLIYLLLAVFVVFQLGVFDGGTYSAMVREKIGIEFAASCGMNIIWILLWHTRQIGLSTVCIVMLLIMLVSILHQLNDIGGNTWQRITAKAGLSVYFGWIIAATIANISVWLTKLGWNGWGISADIWTVAVLLIGAVIAAAVALIGENRVAAMAVMWAYAGILIRHISPTYEGGAHPYIIAAAVAGEAMILAAILLPFIQQACRKRMAVARR